MKSTAFAIGRSLCHKFHSLSYLFFTDRFPFFKLPIMSRRFGSTSFCFRLWLVIFSPYRKTSDVGRKIKSADVSHGAALTDSPVCKEVD